MAGKKKKSLANKLSKMSDEERARYLQHRADMEEEARRRKEQLISTFLKKKIKKEEAFSRLNVAKINLNWHQILRKSKCQEMKENVEHMRKWIERVITFKNRTISKLMQELEEAEEQYLNNFQTHSTHIDKVIERQNEYIDKLQEQYEKDIKVLLETTNSEREMILRNSKDEQDYLKTVLFGQVTEAKKTLRKEHDDHMLKLYEAQVDFEAKLKQLTKSREGVSGAIWKQIATVVRLYVQQTDSRRMHFAELKRLDAESAAEITKNEERIRREEELIQSLRSEHEDLTSDRQLKLKNLEAEAEALNKNFLRIRKTLQSQLQADEKKLKLLTDVAYKTSQYLHRLVTKGEQIRNLAGACKKFETHREKVVKWLPISDVEAYNGEVSGESAALKEKIKIISDHLRDTEITGSEPGASVDEPTASTSKPRPKTAGPGRFVKSARSLADTPTPEPRKVATVKSVRLREKTSQGPSSSTSPPSSSHSSASTYSKDIIERCVDSLKYMENFWFMVNKVEVDYMEVKEEKKILEIENKQLRGMIRAVLEAAALAESIPSSKVSTRLPSKRSAYSAPIRRVLFN